MGATNRPWGRPLSMIVNNSIMALGEGLVRADAFQAQARREKDRYLRYPTLYIYE